MEEFKQIALEYWKRIEDVFKEMTPRVHGMSG
jgi:hypothetical protein